MDSLEKYKEIITEIINEVYEKLDNLENIEAAVSIDSIRGQYLIITDSWEDSQRHYSPLIHIEVKDNFEVWLRCDNTDLEIGNLMIERGIDKKHIIPAFYSPKMRKYIQMG